MSIKLRLENRLEAIRASRPELERHLDVTRQTFQGWINRDSIPITHIYKTATYLDCDPEWLSTGKGKPDRKIAPPAPPAPPASTIKQQADVVRISILGAQGGMGPGISADQIAHDEQVGAFETTRKWVRSRLSHATNMENIRIITGMGDSMKGTYNHGDALFVDTGVNEIKIDAVYALAFDGELFIKRVQRIPGGRIKLISNNQADGYEPILIEHKDLQNFRVIGRVIGALNYNEL